MKPPWRNDEQFSWKLIKLEWINFPTQFLPILWIKSIERTEKNIKQLLGLKILSPKPIIFEAVERESGHLIVLNGQEMILPRWKHLRENIFYVFTCYARRTFQRLRPLSTAFVPVQLYGSICRDDRENAVPHSNIASQGRTEDGNTWKKSSFRKGCEERRWHGLMDTADHSRCPIIAISVQDASGWRAHPPRRTSGLGVLVDEHADGNAPGVRSGWLQLITSPVVNEIDRCNRWNWMILKVDC